MTTLVFTYGTLMQGEGNHRVMVWAGGRYVGEARTAAAFTLLHLGGFPGVVAEGDQAVTGEVYEVADLRPLDRLEGHPNFYRREQVEVTTASGQTVTAWVYLLPPRYLDDHDTIPSGDWRDLPRRSFPAVGDRW
jgi:gamma-glutamylaminecyclotransferase